MCARAPAPAPGVLADDELVGRFQPALRDLVQHHFRGHQLGQAGGRRQLIGVLLEQHAAAFGIDQDRGRRRRLEAVVLLEHLGRGRRPLGLLLGRLLRARGRGGRPHGAGQRGGEHPFAECRKGPAAAGRHPGHDRQRLLCWVRSHRFRSENPRTEDRPPLRIKSPAGALVKMHLGSRRHFRSDSLPRAMLQEQAPCRNSNPGNRSASTPMTATQRK